MNCGFEKLFIVVPFSITLPHLQYLRPDDGVHKRRIDSNALKNRRQTLDLDLDLDLIWIRKYRKMRGSIFMSQKVGI
jgi:hypothetical protein